MEYLTGFALGVVVGGLIVFLVTSIGGRSRQKQMDTMVAQMKDAFAALSQEALTKNSDELIKRAGETLSKQSQAGGLELESKKKLIDQTLESIKSDLLKVERAVTEFDKERAERFAQLSTEVKNSAEQTDKLRQTAGKLEATLASTKMRGQWGERMAEDEIGRAHV
jgi:DNA recombination protein RmuC